MELCNSTFLRCNPTRPRPAPQLSLFSCLSPNPRTPFRPANRSPLNYRKLSLSSALSFSSNFLIFSHPIPSISNAFIALASSVSADTAELDPLPGEIEISEIEQPNSSIKLSIEVPPVVCEDCYKRVMREFMKQAKVPGFRPGKNVPESILTSYVGKENVQKATVESILKRTLPHAMSSVAGRALKDSVRITTKFSEMEKTYSSLNFVRYDVVVDVAPELKWVTENGYKNLQIVVELDSDINAQTAAEKELKRLLDISAVTIGQDGSDGEKIPSAETKDFHFDTEESENLIPGFLDSIVGIRQGETKSFPLVFPESWRQENLRGIQAQFTVECKELFYRDLPLLEDSLADKLIPGCTTLKQVQELLLQRCREVEQNAKDQATDNAILDQLVKMIEVDIPRSLFEEQGRQLYGAKLLEIQANVKLNEEQLQSLSSPKAVDQFLENQKENIINVIKQDLAFSSDELIKEVENSIAEFKRNKQDYDEERIREQVQEILEGAKVLEWLRQHAEIKHLTR
ncbi:Trigger factor, C-terminal [Dillenia turbinata]|uniref:peptidylprolyl isomerase n=1 Tax=Dillenia turbinata TaxID=194707 RepID=A0AAN8WI64_9MAGN